MRETKLGGVTVRLTGGSDREGGGEGPVVVLMHGFGAPGTDLVGLWRVLEGPPHVRFAFPEAPLTMPMLGFGEPRAWWMIDLARLERAVGSGVELDMSEEVPEGMAQARHQVIDMLDALERELGVTSDRLVLGGFSQGAMLALDVALHTDRPFAGLALMSATLLAAREWIPRMSSRAGLPVLQSHGQMDDLLSFAAAERLRDRLVEAGLPVEWVPFRGGHEVPPAVIERLSGFLKRTLASRAP